MARPPQFRETLRSLSQQLRQLGTAPDWGRVRESLRSTGIGELDELLPERGIPPGMLLECLTDGPGTGAGTLAFIAAAVIAGEQRFCVAIDPQQTFYPPAIPQWRTALDRLVVVHPPDESSALWAWEQSLRCTGVAVVVGWLGKLQPQAYRRLKLAAETGGGVGCVLRSVQFQRQPSWADIRLVVRQRITPNPHRVEYRKQDLSLGIEHLAFGIAPQPNHEPRTTNHGPSTHTGTPHKDSLVQGRRLSIELIHAPGVLTHSTLELELDDETGDVRLAPSVAPATIPLQETGT